MAKINIRDLDFEDIIEKRHDARIDYINALTIYERFDEGIDEFKSRIMGRIAKENPNLKRNELLDAAKATDEWTLFLDQKSEAKKFMLELETIYDDWKSAFISKCIMEKKGVKGDEYE